ncbi:MAG: GNAT family N-acetyltransferase [Bdellovibrionales bacterium]|nr:GNAT family N-acetyltransferase [Bdellovibrionales bacterium]
MNIKNIRLREMIPGDIGQLEKLYLQCRKETFHWIPSETFALEDFRKDTEGEWTLVAEIEGKIIGFASVWVQDHFLHHLYIDSQLHSLGVGQALLKRCLTSKLQKPARLKCVVKNTKACKFYEKQGWEIESTSLKGPMGPFHVYVLK